MDCAWAYGTSIPHEKINIYEDGELYCIGIVCDINKPKQTNADRIRAMTDRYWIEFGFVNAFKCSECGRIIYRKEPYCNCGCKMDATPDD